MNEKRQTYKTYNKYTEKNRMEMNCKCGDNCVIMKKTNVYNNKTFYSLSCNCGCFVKKMFDLKDMISLCKSCRTQLYFIDKFKIE